MAMGKRPACARAVVAPLDLVTVGRSRLAELTPVLFGATSPATLAFVKIWRTWLLVLLAVLLPVRGAVAAAMLCQVSGPAVQLALAIAGPSAGNKAMAEAMAEAMDQAPSHHQHAAGHDHARGHDHASGHDHAPDASGDGHPGHDHAASEACNACSAYCSLTPFVGNLPPLVEPLDPTAVKFDDVAAPPPSFVSGGQERPPRTIDP
jgi:hypothetical protein